MITLEADLVERFLRPKAVAEASKGSAWGQSDTVWVEDVEGTDGFLLVRPLKDDPSRAELEDSGAIISLNLGKGESRRVEKSNPSRNDRTEDMASMTELNEATVLNNLGRRYHSNLIYTYSGLFLVALNPYKTLPIYGESVMAWYEGTGSDREARPPHIFATADQAFKEMLGQRKDQSILITGESGAGKTENTKRVIQYLAGRSGKAAAGLEARIIQANPIMEAFGNAQTIRNNNSSRFGKFIKIEFDRSGAIVGAHIEKYLLEKGRVTNRSGKERNFHVFYQLLRGAPATMRERIGLGPSEGVDSFAYTKNGNVSIEGLDDKAEWENLIMAMNTLGFGESEQESFFRILAIILLIGNLQLSEDSKGQAHFTDISQVEKVCKQAGVPVEAFAKALLNPVIKAGQEIVEQGRDLAQVKQSIEALSRALYDRLFTSLVDRINEALDTGIKTGSTKGQETNFIGVLDIAGFEIFDKNSFEQLCVNYTNEKLQQFFNHHMFVQEQEEYRKERVDWNFVDFGLDLQPTIDLLERANPIGILACLDEDCVVPKATDKSYCEKLGRLWRGKSEKFEVSRFGDAFIINHYAGKVEYSTEGWLEKNKDPLNENVTKLLACSTDQFIAELFSDYSTDDSRLTGFTSPVKRGQFRTVSQKYRESLTLLMQQLYSTQPHFVRCIIPNEEKQPGVLNAKLILDQLRCNGVLEGIRICRMGFPNRVLYTDFCRLYEIMAKEPLDGDRKLATKQLLQQLEIDPSMFRLGATKVFFKAGQLGKLDELKDGRLATILSQFQAHCRGALARLSKNRLVKQQEAKETLQRNFKRAAQLKQWDWYRLFCRVKPLLNVTRAESRIEELEDEVERIIEEREQQTGQLREELDAERNKLIELESTKRDFERQLQQLQIQLTDTEEAKTELQDRIMAIKEESRQVQASLEQEIDRLKKEVDTKELSLCKVQTESTAAINALKQELSQLKVLVEEAELEKARFERAETSLKAKLEELEGNLEELKAFKKDLEQRLKQSEETRRQLQDQLEDDKLSSEKQQALQSEFESQLRIVKQRHQEEQEQRQEEFEVAKKRLTREILQLTSDLEQERKQCSAHRETIRDYESGNDSLANKLEAELRNQEGWRREKERLETRIKELVKSNQELAEREDLIQAQLFTSNEQARDQRARLAGLEDEIMALERQKKLLEGKLEKSTEACYTLTGQLEAAETKLTTIDAKLHDALGRLAEEQDEVVVLKEKLRLAEHLAKIQELKAEDAQKNLDEAHSTVQRLEAQVRDLQMRLLDSNGTFQSTASPTSQALNHLKSQIEAESDEKQALLRDSRRQDRLIQSLQDRLSDADRDRSLLEESLTKQDIKYRKAMTRLDQVEQALGEAEFGRRRAERELVEERQEKDRLQRELERTKARLINN